MLTISTGYSVDYLTKEVAAGRENYYTGAVAAGEPPGRWYGGGAEKLGLSGLVDHQDMTALYEAFIDPRDEAFSDPERWGEASRLGHTGRRYRTEQQWYDEALNAEPEASAERRAELWLEAGKKAQRNVAFLDATFSVQKSITVLHTAFEAQEVAARHAGAETEADAWGTHRRAVEDAIWAGNRAALDYLQGHAGYSRIGHHGGAAGRYLDAHDWTVASFFQHDNRDHDPQLHIHNAILNRVQGVDGKWRTVDSKAMHKFRGAASAVAERTTEEHLSHALGVRFATRPDGKAREVVGIAPEVMDLFSSRRRAITKRAGELVEVFETKFGRAPNSLELDRLQRQATFATRRAKSHEGETVEQRLERWDQQLRAEVAGGLASVARGVLELDHEQDAAEWSPRAVVETALADVQSRKAAWTRADLTRAISDALPDHVGVADGHAVAELLDSLTTTALDAAVALDAERPGDVALPAELRLADGRSAYDAPAGRLYATPEHVHTERALTTATAEGGAAAMTGAAAQRFLEELRASGIELGADQTAAVHGVLTSGARIESLIGPAGTGKSFVVGTVARAWQDPTVWGDARPRTVFGLASSQIATEVLAGEGVEARNVARWLATQQRLADGSAAADDVEWRLHDGDVVVVDESAMTDTADLAAIHGHAAAAGAKVLLVGDHRQLAAVGAGGGMDLVAEHGAAYELADARRFVAEWERDGSLRLRAGDQSVLDTYHRHGRLRDGGAIEQTEQAAARAWLGDTLAGKQSLLLVDTNEQAARLSAQLRAELVRLGHVAEQGVPLGLQGTYAGVGDLVQARRNGWDLAGHAGNRRGPINREQYRVLDTTDRGGLVVAPILGRVDGVEQLGERMTLPAGYVTEHVALGYASTVHAAQGVTVDTSHGVVTSRTGAEALYVELSRGRESNTAHVVTVTAPDDAATGETAEALHRSPAAVLASTLEGADPTRSALATATESAREAGSVRTPAELFADAVELATAGRTAAWLDELATDGVLSDEQRARLAAEDGAANLSKVLRRAELAGHDPKQVLRSAVTEDALDDARQLTSVLRHRITTVRQLDPTTDSYTDRVPQVDDPEWATYLDTLAHTADQRQATLGEQQAAQPEPWALEAFGPVPTEQESLTRWVRAVGTVAAHRELTGQEDPVEAVGAPPKAGQVEAYASWRSAWRALGRPEADRDELELSDGQLRVRVRAAERENTWAPRYVANELAGTRETAEQYSYTAALRTAEAQAADDVAQQERLQREADEAAALAETLQARTAELETAEQARGQWLAHTAATRAAADRAAAELSARHADEAEVEQTVTADEWLAAHREADAVEDPHRAVTAEHELADLTRERDADTTVADATADVDEQPDTAAETQVEDVRDATEAAQADEDAVRVPSADETADTVDRAQQALAAMAERQAAERAREAEEAQAAQIARWHADEAQAAAERAAEQDALGVEA